MSDGKRRYLFLLYTKPLIPQMMYGPVQTSMAPKKPVNLVILMHTQYEVILEPFQKGSGQESGVV